MRRKQISKVLYGKYLSFPHGIFEKIKNIGEVEVVLKLGNKQDQRTVGEDAEDERVRKAFEQYRKKYPDELVDMGDFQYIGILPRGDSEIN
jgi:hypothetical protein